MIVYLSHIKKTRNCSFFKIRKSKVHFCINMMNREKIKRLIDKTLGQKVLGAAWF
jgi:hypothetical protein